MTGLDTASFRRRLEQRREELLAVAATGEEASKTVELDQQRVGRLSRMDALQSQAISAEAKRRRDLELRRIAAALRRLDEGEYGYCDACGELIAGGRLSIDPAAELCVRCASEAEKR
ncbi:MAG: TraR/DksA C4-type zinc finger protein [Gammaproteobacteria bacterium]